MIPRAAARALGALSAATGLVILAEPEAVLHAVSSQRPDPFDTFVARVLGARSAVQGAALLALPRRRLVYAAAMVDLTHAASMVALAALRPEHRRAALCSAALASFTGSLGVATARRVAR
ncbi:MAG: hypothetical protein ACRDWT_13475 [Jatrophihabitantaceae bacterium]